MTCDVTFFLELICATVLLSRLFSATLRRPNSSHHVSTQAARVGGDTSQTIQVTILQFGTEIRLSITRPTSPTPLKSPGRFESWNALSAAHSRFLDFARAQDSSHFVITQCLAGRRRHLDNGSEFNLAILRGDSDFYYASNEPNPVKNVPTVRTLERFSRGPS